MDEIAQRNDTKPALIVVWRKNINPSRRCAVSSLQKTAAAIFDAVVDDGQSSAALEAVAKFVGVSGAGSVMLNKFTGQISSAAWWGSFTGRPADYVSHYGKIDPSRALWDKAAASGRLLRVSESLPQSVLRHDEWYNEWLLSGGVCDILGTTLYESPSRKISFGLHRAIGDVDPFPRHAERLQALMPLLQNAARLRVWLIDAGYRSVLGSGRLQHLAAAAILADAGGRVVEANQAAERILRLGDGLTIRDGQICARRNFETRKLASLIASVVGGESGVSVGCMLVARDCGPPSYVVRVGSVSAGQAGYDLPMAEVLVSLPNDNRVSEGELAELYGLSPAESRVAIALAQGKRLTELAAEWSLQITTLRTQLSSILKKCEVERQSDLVRIVLSIPVVHPLPSETDRPEAGTCSA